MKNKLKRYLQNKQNNYIIEEGKFTYNKLKGNWNKIFKNNNPIFLELACGNGEYTINNSIKFQNNNYIGIDIKGSRLWKGGQKLKEIKSKNAFFLRVQIENILDFFDNNEVSEILIVFPDPRPKKRDIKKRLTSQNFISKYYKIMSCYCSHTTNLLEYFSTGSNQQNLNSIKTSASKKNQRKNG